jgi:dihydrofolate reductase
MKISCIVAADKNNGIGKNNQLLCHLPVDLKYFKNLTTHHAILMGRKTFESIGKPLPNRTNIIISRSELNIEGTYCFKSIDEGISFAKSQNETELFIIGGDSIYQQSMHVLDTVYLTRIHYIFEADAFFPTLQEEYWQLNQDEFHAADEKNKFDFSFQSYHRK